MVMATGRRADAIEALEVQSAIMRTWGRAEAMAAMAGLMEGAGGMIRPGLSVDEAADTMRTAIIVSLASASPFYWAPPICEAVESAAGTMPDWTLTPESVPAAHAFFWFARSLTLPGIEPAMHLRAIAWSLGTEHDGQSLLIHGDAPIDEGDFLKVVWFIDHADEGRDRPTIIPMPATVASWPVGRPYGDLFASGDVGAMRSPARMELKFRYLAACLAFLGQQIFVTRPERPDRAARRRLERDGWTHDPVVKVVELRHRSERPHPTDAHESIAWSCRWIVRGHWRQQWYPSLSRHQAKWVSPYVKGPDDRPLKRPTTQVFAVVR